VNFQKKPFTYRRIAFSRAERRFYYVQPKGFYIDKTPLSRGRTEVYVFYQSAACVSFNVIKCAKINYFNERNCREFECAHDYNSTPEN